VEGVQPGLGKAFSAYGVFFSAGFYQFQTMILRWFEIAPKRCALSLCSLCPFRTDRSNRFSSPEVPINCHLGRKYPRSPLRVLSNGPLMTPGGRAIACCVLWQTFRFCVRRDHRAGSTGVGPERFRTRTQLQNVVLNMATVCSSDRSATQRRGECMRKTNRAVSTRKLSS
jgi:hypothetical protein